MSRAKHVPYLDTAEEGLSPDTSHPAYVAAAPDWFWSGGDPRAPFGSDDGHDTLSTLREHFVRGGTDQHVPGCVADLVAGWALVPEPVWDSSAEEVTAWLDADGSHVRFLHGEIDAYIAAACGQFKTSGWIHPALRFWAERAMTLLEHVLDPWEQKAFGIRPGSYDEKVAATRAVIAAAPEPPEKMQLRVYQDPTKVKKRRTR